MAQIYKLFSITEEAPASHSLESANRLLPAVRRLTEEAVQSSSQVLVKMRLLGRHHIEYQSLSREYDRILMHWVEQIHRLGAIAKGLWLVDFDTGDGYLCWAYPETKVEYFHSYAGGFSTRKRLRSSDDHVTGQS